MQIAYVSLLLKNILSKDLLQHKSHIRDKDLTKMIQKLFFYILLMSPVVSCYNRRFLKIENCTTSGKTSFIQECQFKDNRFNFSLNIFKGSNVSNVLQFRSILLKLSNFILNHIVSDNSL